MHFPHTFAWGISSSAYQTEDVVLTPRDPHFFKTDWDLFFEAGKLKTPKGSGTFSYSEYERDILALKSLGLTHYRFGIEWARIEPHPGEFNDEAIERYVNIAKRLRREGITPVVALWHFTFPSWLTNLDDGAQHGWLHPECKIRWPIYVERVVERLAADVEWFAPQNEPNTQASMGYLANLWPPGDLLSTVLYYKNLNAAADAYRDAAAIVRRLKPSAQIVSIQNVVHWQPSSFDVFKKFYGWGQEFNFYHLDRIAEVTDLIGFTYYMGEVASPTALWQKKKKDLPNASDLGWPIDPQGLRNLIVEISGRYQKPLVIMENGIADAHDKKRPVYLTEHLGSVRWAIEHQYDVRGYFHWSLIDNYEWAYGYDPKFGLFHFEGHSKLIKPKRSAHLYKDFIAAAL